MAQISSISSMLNQHGKTARASVFAIEVASAIKAAIKTAIDAATKAVITTLIKSTTPKSITER